MSLNGSTKIESVRQAVEILARAEQKLNEHDPASAQIMIGVAIHVLENLSADLNQHLNMERMLRRILEQN